MDLDIKSKMPAARWTELAKAELRNNTENLRYIFCRRATPAGYLDEAFLTPNAVAAYTGIGPDDSDYRAASDMAKGQMHRTNMRRGLQRRFLRGESY